MEHIAESVRTILKNLIRQETGVKETFLLYVIALEDEYAESEDIYLFIYGVRCFFCWHRAEELLKNREWLQEIQASWKEQNDTAYEQWLRSPDDEIKKLKWEKWTYQAKMAVLEDVIELDRLKGAGAAAAAVAVAAAEKSA